MTLAFVHVPKTGGQTITYSLLRSSFGIRHCDVLPWLGENIVDPFLAEDLRLVQRIHPRLDSIAGHSVMLYVDLYSVCPDIQYYAFVREPVAQYVSHYQYIRQHVEPDLKFEDWLQRERYHNNQTKMFAGNASVSDAIKLIHKKCAFVGLTERFDESLLLFKTLFAKNLNIAYESKNVASDRTIVRDLLARASTYDAIAQFCQADLELYEYVANELYPTYQSEYGKTLEKDVVTYQSDRGRLQSYNILANRAYRNLVYKPARKLYRLLHSRM